MRSWAWAAASSRQVGEQNRNCSSGVGSLHRAHGCSFWVVILFLLLWDMVCFFWVWVKGVGLGI